MKIIATIQARMGSTRLPGKVLRPILGRPMLALQIERIQRSRLIDEVVVATSTSPQDDAIERLARDLGVGCFRGSEEDVLTRVVQALQTHRADVHVELTGDSPLPDPLIVDSLVGYYLKHASAYDVVSNAITISYPPGLDVFVYPAQVLVDAAGRVTDPRLREHVNIHLTRHPERYRLCNLQAPPEFRAPELYLEVDSPEDLGVIQAIYEYCYPRNPGFGLGEMLAFLREHPELASRNRGVERRWKQFRTVAA